MVVYPLLCTGNLLIQTSTYSGIGTHNLSAKFSVINTLSHSVKTVWSNPELIKQEKEHLRKPTHSMQISQVGFGQGGGKGSTSLPVRPLMRVNNQGANGTPDATREVKSKDHIVIPYTQGLCESIKN